MKFTDSKDSVKVNQILTLFVYLTGAKLLDSDGKPELQILICYNHPQQAVKTYKEKMAD